jgi:hypothetical protein
MEMPVKFTAESESCSHCSQLYNFRAYREVDQFGNEVSSFYGTPIRATACGKCRKSSFNKAFLEWLDMGEDSNFFQNVIETNLDTSNLNGVHEGKKVWNPRWQRVVKSGKMQYMKEQDWIDMIPQFPPDIH